MFKKSIMLPVLAVIAGAAASAFTTVNSSSKANTSQQTYYWYVSPYSGSDFQAVATTDDEASITGCSGTQVECQKGFTQDQLVNGDPSQGVQQSQQATPASEIYQQP